MPPQPSQDWSARSRELSHLLSRAGLGDRAAFATLYEKSSSHLFAVVLRICRDRAQAEDILQEVYVKVWRAAGGFDAAQSQPLTWLTSIARNRAIDSLRRAIPDKGTRILIYCNNNFLNAEGPFPSKLPSASLNLSTYIALYNYGYRNVYELAPLIDIGRSQLEFESR